MRVHREGGGDRATETLLGQPFIRLADKQAAALSNVKGSLVLLFYQSNKLEMFAATPPPPPQSPHSTPFPPPRAD